MLSRAQDKAREWAAAAPARTVSRVSCVAAGPGAYHVALNVGAMCAMLDWASGVGGATNVGPASRDPTIGNEGYVNLFILIKLNNGLTFIC